MLGRVGTVGISDASMNVDLSVWKVVKRLACVYARMQLLMFAWDAVSAFGGVIGDCTNSFFE